MRLHSGCTLRTFWQFFGLLAAVFPFVAAIDLPLLGAGTRHLDTDIGSGTHRVLGSVKSMLLCVGVNLGARSGAFPYSAVALVLALTADWWHCKLTIDLAGLVSEQCWCEWWCWGANTREAGAKSDLKTAIGTHW